MEIPVKYIFHGDRQRCEELYGQARRLSFILDNMMALGELQQQIIKFVPYPGALIVARKFFGTRVIDIYTGPAVQQQGVGEIKICLCNCNFSIGWIFEVQDGANVGGAQLYTVMACNRDGNVFVKYPNVLASDWTPYVVGQRVVLVPYQAMAYVCCTDPTGDPGPRGCTPMVNPNDVTSQDWRTTYRIIPLCEKAIPMKIDPARWNPDG